MYKTIKTIIQIHKFYEQTYKETAEIFALRMEAVAKEKKDELLKK